VIKQNIEQRADGWEELLLQRVAALSGYCIPW
jgi:hypothetical protein